MLGGRHVIIRILDPQFLNLLVMAFHDWVVQVDPRLLPG